MTKNQIKRLTQDLNIIAKEALSFEIIDSHIYAFGSELATLRLLNKYRECKDARVNFSSNLKSYYFVLDTTLKASLKVA